jgi:hypothetical protein
MRPRICSGGMYAAVPRMTPGAVSSRASVGESDACADEMPLAPSLAYAFAKPKSSTFAMPAGVSFTLAGLRSR